MSKHPSDRHVALDAAVALHRQQFAIQIDRGDLDGAGDDVIGTAALIFGWLTRPADHDPVLIALATRIASLEDRMAKTETALADLNDATNEVATRLDALSARIESTDSETAAQISAAADRLRGLAADPNNPVPPVDPNAPV